MRSPLYTTPLRRSNVATGKPAPQPLNQHSSQNNNSEQEPNDDHGANYIQFCLVFVIARGNSVQQMIKGASLDIPSGHGDASLAGTAPLESAMGVE